MHPQRTRDVSRESFAELVRSALQCLDNPAALQTSPLVASLVGEVPGETTAGEQLRQILLQAIEATRPAERLPQCDPGWRSYHLLKLRYVEHKSRYAVCETLAIGQASYYRCRRQALEGLAAILWQRARSLPLTSTEQAPGDAGSATREALRIAQTEPREAIDLAQITQSAVNTLTPLLDRPESRLRLDLSDQPLTACANPGMLHQALLDILINGTELLGTEGVILRLARRGDRAVWELACRTAARQPAPALDADRFSFGRALLSVYGGGLDLYQQPDEAGIRFEVPLAEPRTVLLVDDSEDTIRLYSRWLGAHGYMVRTARHEEELRSQLAERPPDLILLDVLMPDWDGWMALQDLKARQETRRIPVVISSVLSRPRLALALGAAEVLTKPITESQLIEAVQRVMDREDSAEEPPPAGS